MKAFKITRIIVFLITLLTGGYAAYATFMVSGDKLLYSSVEMGRWLAVSYKWAIALFCVLLFADLVLTLAAKKNRRD